MKLFVNKLEDYFLCHPLISSPKSKSPQESILINCEILTLTLLAQNYCCSLPDVSNNSHYFSEDDAVASLQNDFSVGDVPAGHFHGWSVHRIFHKRTVFRRCVFGCATSGRWTGWKRDRNMCICMVDHRCEFACDVSACCHVRTLTIWISINFRY